MSKHDNLANYLAKSKKEYAEGVQIFKDLDVDRESNKFFDVESPSRLHINLLNKKLMNYARVNKVRPSVKKKNPASGDGENTPTPPTTTNPPVQSGKITERPLIDTNPNVRYEDLPSDLQEKFKNAGEMSNEQKTLHAELKSLGDKPEAEERRAELAKDITERKKQIKEIWAEIDSWWNANKGKTKEQQIADKAAADAIEKEKRIKANKTYIQRNYVNPKKPDELQNRMKELENWGVDFSDDIEKAKNNSAESE